MNPTAQTALPLVDDALFIDNSSLEVFSTCARAAQYYICEKRESSEERSALGFGKRIHSILESRYRLNTGVIPPSGDESGTAARMFATAQAVFADHVPTGEEDYRNFSTATEFISKYNEFYPVEGFEILRLADGTPAIEIPFALPIGELEINGELLVRGLDGGPPTLKHFDKIKIIWQGRIDMIVRQNNGIYILDHKTTSMMGPNYFKEFDLSHQVYGYIHSASVLLNSPVAGFIVNALAIRKPTKTGKAFEFQRYPIHTEQGLLGEWLTDTMYLVSDFVEMARRGYFPKMTKWCVGKYGTCQYHHICGLPPHSRNIMLHSGNFREVKWNPLTNKDT